MVMRQTLIRNKRIGLVALFMLVLLTPTSAEADLRTLGRFPHDRVRDERWVVAPKSDRAYHYSRFDCYGTVVTCTLNRLEDQTECFFLAGAYDGGIEKAEYKKMHCIPPYPLTPVRQFNLENEKA